MAMITVNMMNLKILIDHYKKKESLVRGFSFWAKNTPDNNQKRFFLIMSIGFQLYNLFGRADILSFGYSGCRPNDNIFPCTFTSYHIKKENSICAEPGECIFSLCMILIIRPTLQPKGDRAANTYQNLRVF